MTPNAIDEFPAWNAADEESSRDIYTVSRLNREVRFLLARNFLSIWVDGEISNLAFPSSGHLYFTLKDDQAQVRCAMFAGKRRELSFRPADGCRVLVKAQVGLYEVRGDYQLIIDSMEEAGDGALRRAFEALKKKLAAEGLFDASRKRPIPRLPKKIGVISSPSGAALRDILTVLKRRFPAIGVVLYPVTVQGSEAKHEIVAALDTADRRRECSVLLLARGGGSLEDLWAFNEEIVARAMSRCSLPIVTGIGHETDFTIADFVADLRAPTPSAAAEAASPEQSEWQRNFEVLEQRLGRIQQSRIAHHHRDLEWLSGRLSQCHPGRRLQDRAQRMDELELRLRQSMNARILAVQSRLKTVSARLHGVKPIAQIRLAQIRQRHLSQRLGQAISRLVEDRKQSLARLSHTLDALSPLVTLFRGYSITRRCDDGRILRSVEHTEVGQIVETVLFQGRLICEVKETKNHTF